MANQPPNTSIILPTYNRGHLIRPSIESVLNQTFTDFELLVIDDGSTDNTDELVRGIDDRRVSYVKCDQNRGANAARNTGIRLAKGKYIAFQDSDTEWFPEKLEKQIRSIESSEGNIGAVYTGMHIVHGKKRTYIPNASVSQVEGDIHRELLKGNFVGTPALLVKKECFKKVSLFDESLPALQDWEFVIRLSKEFDFNYISEPLLTAYFVADSISSLNKNNHRALQLVLEKHIALFEDEKKLLSTYCFSIASWLCSVGERDKCRSYLRKSITANPMNIQAISSFLFSFLGYNVYKNALVTYRRIRYGKQ